MNSLSEITLAFTGWVIITFIIKYERDRDFRWALLTLSFLIMWMGFCIKNRLEEIHTEIKKQGAVYEQEAKPAK